MTTNIIINGNCLEELRKLKDKFQLLITDPPQFILINDNIEFKNREAIVRNADFDLFNSYEDFLKFTVDWVELCARNIDNNSTACIFFANQYITDLINICDMYELKYFDTFYWHKINPAPKIRKKGFLSSVETAVIFKKGNPVFNFFKQNDMHNFMETPICSGKERIKNKQGKTLHPTQKPIKLISNFIKILSNIGDNVIDPFSGTGTTNYCCKYLKRNCLGIELNEEYHSASVLRTNTLTTTKAGVLSWI